VTDEQINKLLDDIHGGAFPDRMQLTGEQVRERERQLVRDFVAEQGRPSGRGAAKLASSRGQLLARVAGDVASGIMTTPSASTPSAAAVAAIAVDVAEEILKKIDL
jgi:hypothetical protein